MLLGFVSFLLAEPPANASGSAPWGIMMLWLPMLAILYVFMIYLPNRRQEKQRIAQVSALKKNDKIINSGGIIGIIDVVKDNEDEIILRGGLRITKSSIVRVVSGDESPKSS